MMAVAETGVRSGVAAGVGFSSSPFVPQLAAAERLEQIDLTDPRLFLLGDPHAAWKQLRDEAPVYWHARGARGTHGQGFWAVTRFADCAAVHRQHEVFSNAQTEFLDLLPEDMPMQLSSMDAPLHMHYRRAVQRFFTPKEIEKREAEVRAIVGSILDAASQQDGSFNFHTQIAAQVPFLATCGLLGIDAQGAQAMADRLHALDYAGQDPLAAYANTVMKFFEDATAQWPRDNPDSILSAVLNADIGGTPITHADAMAYLWILFTGALDTTAHAASTGLLSLFQHPDQLARIRANPLLAGEAVGELLRWTSTSNVVKHVVKVDTELAGVKIRAGDHVATYPPSANRDERVFADPYRFDITRKLDSGIFTFGGGPHVCLGQHFARLELRVLFEELFRRFPDIEQAGPSSRGEAFTLTLSPIAELPVKLNG